MLKNIKYSIVIPLYNKAEHIKRAIDSVLSQTINNYELIIVNDGSSDGGENHVKKYNDSRIKLINQKNQGVSVARNKGILESKGNYIAFLDADDEWLPDFLETVNLLINTYPTASAYSTSYYYITPEYKKEIKYFKSLPTQPWEGILPSYFKVSYRNGSPMWTSTTCIKRDVFEDIGMFKAEMRLAEDIDLWVRVALNYKIAFTTDCKGIYHTESDNRTPTVAGAPKIDPHFVTLLQEELDNNELPKELREDVEKFIATYLISFSQLNMDAGDYNQAKKFLFDKRCSKFFKLQIKYIFLYYFKYFINLIKK